MYFLLKMGDIPLLCDRLPEGLPSTSQAANLMSCHDVLIKIHSFSTHRTQMVGQGKGNLVKLEAKKTRTCSTFCQATNSLSFDKR